MFSDNIIYKRAKLSCIIIFPMSIALLYLANLNNYEGESHTQEEKGELGRALKSGSLRVRSGVATWASPCAVVRGLQGTTPSPEGGSLAVKIRTGVKKTPLYINQTLKSPGRIGKRSVPRRFKSWNMTLRQVMWGVPEKLMKGMTVSRVIGRVGSQSVPMGRRKTGAHNHAHFKGEGGSTSMKRPGGNTCMEDQGRTDAAILDEKGRGEQYSLLIFRKADGFTKGRFLIRGHLEERLSTASNGIHEDDNYFMMFSMICTFRRLPKGALNGLKVSFLVYMRGRINIISIFENETLKEKDFLTVFSEMKLGVYGLISFLENICECINGFSSLKTIGNGPAIRDSLSFYRIISIL